MPFDLNGFLEENDPDALGDAGSGEATQVAETHAEPQETQPSTSLVDSFEKRFSGLKQHIKTDEDLFAAIERMGESSRRFEEIQPTLAEYAEHAEEFRAWREARDKKPAEKPEAAPAAAPTKPARPEPPEWEDDWARLVVRDPQTGRLKARFNGVDPSIVRKAEARMRWEQSNQRRILTEPVGYLQELGLFDAVKESLVGPAVGETKKELLARIEALENSIKQRHEDAEFDAVRKQRSAGFLALDEAGRPVFDPHGRPVMNESGAQFSAVHDMAAALAMKSGMDNRAASRFAWELASNMLDAAAQAAAKQQQQKQPPAAKTGKPASQANRISAAVAAAIKNGANTNPAETATINGGGDTVRSKRPRNHAAEALAKHREMFGDEE